MWDKIKSWGAKAYTGIRDFLVEEHGQLSNPEAFKQTKEIFQGKRKINKSNIIGAVRGAGLSAVRLGQLSGLAQNYIPQFRVAKELTNFVTKGRTKKAEKENAEFLAGIAQSLAPRNADEELGMKGFDVASLLYAPLKSSNVAGGFTKLTNPKQIQDLAIKTTGRELTSDAIKKIRNTQNPEKIGKALSEGMVYQIGDRTFIPSAKNVVESSKQAISKLFEDYSIGNMFRQINFKKRDWGHILATASSKLQPEELEKALSKTMNNKDSYEIMVASGGKLTPEETLVAHATGTIFKEVKAITKTDPTPQVKNFIAESATKMIKISSKVSDLDSMTSSIVERSVTALSKQIPDASKNSQKYFSTKARIADEMQNYILTPDLAKTKIGIIDKTNHIASKAGRYKELGGTTAKQISRLKKEHSEVLSDVHKYAKERLSKSDSETVLSKLQVGKIKTSNQVETILDRIDELATKKIAYDIKLSAVESLTEGLKKTEQRAIINSLRSGKKSDKYLKKASIVIKKRVKDFVKLNKLKEQALAKSEKLLNKADRRKLDSKIKKATTKAQIKNLVNATIDLAKKNKEKALTDVAVQKMLSKVKKSLSAKDGKSLSSRLRQGKIRTEEAIAKAYKQLDEKIAQAKVAEAKKKDSILINKSVIKTQDEIKSLSAPSAVTADLNKLATKIKNASLTEKKTLLDEFKTQSNIISQMGESVSKQVTKYDDVIKAASDKLSPPELKIALFRLKIPKATSSMRQKLWLEFDEGVRLRKVLSERIKTLKEGDTFVKTAFVPLLKTERYFRNGIKQFKVIPEIITNRELKQAFKVPSEGKFWKRKMAEFTTLQTAKRYGSKMKGVLEAVDTTEILAQRAKNTFLAEKKKLKKVNPKKTWIKYQEKKLLNKKEKAFIDFHLKWNKVLLKEYIKNRPSFKKKQFYDFFQISKKEVKYIKKYGFTIGREKYWHDNPMDSKKISTSVEGLLKANPSAMKGRTRVLDNETRSFDSLNLLEMSLFNSFDALQSKRQGLMLDLVINASGSKSSKNVSYLESLKNRLRTPEKAGVIEKTVDIWTKLIYAKYLSLSIFSATKNIVGGKAMHLIKSGVTPFISSHLRTGVRMKKAHSSYVLNGLDVGTHTDFMLAKNVLWKGMDKGLEVSLINQVVAEKINRIPAYVDAVYKKYSSKEAKAIIKGDKLIPEKDLSSVLDLIDETQGVYTAMRMPEILGSGLGRVLSMMKKWQIVAFRMNKNAVIDVVEGARTGNGKQFRAGAGVLTRTIVVGAVAKEALKELNKNPGTDPVAHERKQKLLETIIDSAHIAETLVDPKIMTEHVTDSLVAKELAYEKAQVKLALDKFGYTTLTSDDRRKAERAVKSNYFAPKAFLEEIKVIKPETPKKMAYRWENLKRTDPTQYGKEYRELKALAKTDKKAEALFENIARYQDWYKLGITNAEGSIYWGHRTNFAKRASAIRDELKGLTPYERATTIGRLRRAGILDKKTEEFLDLYDSLNTSNPPEAVIEHLKLKQKKYKHKTTDKYNII